ncbi:hypothetical protein IGI04_042943 [Brassica rapa subsp. trilocularis]|uniref:Uncharacterized protein n=1 Tax=Brassica rapa subsp. trilocularis TaxID=1813537 RepID=A0ABQ7KKJ1_BRACM|nr:hypothetical protein IGI04_042943 [Brassica rapa subsp. trilocularis]
MHKQCKDARLTSAGLCVHDFPTGTEMPRTNIVQSKLNKFLPDSVRKQRARISVPTSIKHARGRKTEGRVVHTDVRVCPSAHTGRPWPSVSTHRTSGCPSVHISARSVDCSGRPSAHAGRPWLSVCVRVSVSAHRTSVSTHRTSVSTRRTRRTSVAVRVCPCVRQHTQDVRQYTQDVRQHTKDVRGRPSVHRGRPWPSVSTHRTSVSKQRTSVAVRQHTQGVRQHTQDVRVCPCVRQYTQDVRQHTQDVRQYTQDVRQDTQDVRGRPSVHISACWPFLWTVRVILAHVGCLFSTHRTSVSTHRTSVPVR